ncbi:MAG: ABC transporter substrate-binding protein [Planctomycetes bacterium]|nr:ABC transporter substrate-binding protein [Planctomycetota bacterium]
MTVRSWILTIVLLAPAALLLAFGPQGTRPRPGGRTVIRYWDKWTGVEGAAMQRIVDRFNATVGAEHNVWVDYNALGDVDKRMLIAAAGGDPPDIAGIFDRYVPTYADRGALLPLEEFVAQAGIPLADFKPIWLDICRYDGRLYALPSTPYTIALFYNRRLFREAGLDPDRPPQTTAELIDYAVRLTKFDPSKKDRITQLGFTLSPAMLGWWHWIWPYFFDGSLWDGQRATIDAPATHAAMQWIQDFRNRVGNEAALRFEASCGAIDSAQNPFLNGSLAMVFQGPWLANWARVYAPELDYGVAAFPSVTTERRHVFASEDVFVIPRGAKHIHEAMIFLSFALRQDTLEELCREHGKTSPFLKPGPDFFRLHQNPKIRIFDELASSPLAFGYPPMPTFSEAWTETLYMVETVLRASRPAAEAIRMTQTKVSQVVRQYDEMSSRRRAGKQQ